MHWIIHSIQEMFGLVRPMKQQTKLNWVFLIQGSAQLCNLVSVPHRSLHLWWFKVPHVNLFCSGLSLAVRVFSRDVVLGGIAFVGRENVKNIQKQTKFCYCLGGKFKTLGVEISPPKGPEKNTACSSCVEGEPREWGYSSCGLKCWEVVQSNHYLPV